ncbi:MAG: hypothetical protein LBU17_08610 [Treponema sp.]|jgi:hypothetical protein|nr:hypothetical protein [Treponema sp.]
MDTAIEFNPAAFKHGVTEDDIRWAVHTKVYDAPMDDDANKCLIIGFNLAGNPLEVMYNPMYDGSINVFHAMRCRARVITELGL